MTKYYVMSNMDASCHEHTVVPCETLHDAMLAFREMMSYAKPTLVKVIEVSLKAHDRTGNQYADVSIYDG